MKSIFYVAFIPILAFGLNLLSGKTAFITGCSKGIGLGLAQSLLKCGCFVIATCRDPTKCVELNALCERADGRMLIFPLDVKSRSSHAVAKEFLLSQGIAKIDILIANAGISSRNHPIDPVLSCSEEDMISVYETNVIGTLLTLQSYTDLVCKSEGKLCLVMSSLLGSIERASDVGGYTSYRATKAAVNMIAVTYAADQLVKENGVKVLLVHPGWVQTDLGGSGGRTAPLSVEDSTDGITRVINRAVAIQTNTLFSSQDPSLGLISTQDLNSFDTDEDNFDRNFRVKNCIYTSYDFKLLPW